MARPLSYAYARNNCVLVTDVVDGNIQLHCCLATPPSAIAELQRVLSAPIKLVMQDEASLREQINDTFQRQQGDAMSEIGDISNEVDLDRLVDEIPESQDLLDAQDDAPVIRLINALFGEALKRDASDIHIETYEKTMSVRLRVDGILQEVLTPSRRLAPLLVSRIKVMSRLDIAEKRVPQDGRVSLRIAGRSVDIRVSTIPSNYGERVVMRLLDKQAARIDLAHLGLRDETLSKMKGVLAQPNGIFLVTGPTGSGKSTTLYAALMSLNDRRRNILTVEDPIEYDIEGIGQTQVHSKVGMSFARGLRAILRQDPDVVMVGEIRDQETAEMAVQASLTGHLVLSTLHTNTAIGAVTRLVDIGVEPYLIASSLKGVMAQRLVRKLCQHCRVEISMDKAEARLLGDPALEGQRAYSAGGCEHCQNTGYKGRQGVYELLIIDREISDMIHNRAGEQEIMRYLGTRLNSLMAEGRRLVCAGQTSIDELLRSVREDSDASL